MKRLFVILLLVTILAGCSGSGTAMQEGSADWTSFRGDGSLSGSVSAALPSQPALLWSTSTGQRTVASPLIKDGIIYTLGRRGLLRAVDAQGKEVFTKDFATFIEATPLLVDTTLFIGTIDGCRSAGGCPSGT